MDQGQHRKTQSTFDRYTSGYGVASFPARIRPEQVEAGCNLTPFQQSGAIHILASCMVIWPELPSHHTMYIAKDSDRTCQRSCWALRLCRMPRAAWRSLLHRYKRNNGCICEMSYAVCGTDRYVVSHFCAEEVRCRFHVDRNGQSSSNRLELFNRQKQLWAPYPRLQTAGLRKASTKRGGETIAFFLGKHAKETRLLLSMSTSHDGSWMFMVLSDFWRNSQDFQAVECWMELWLALISWFLRQGKGGKADPSSWIGMLAFVPKTAHPAALVQLLPERAAFGRLKRLGHSARWEILLCVTHSRMWGVKVVSRVEGCDINTAFTFLLYISIVELYWAHIICLFMFLFIILIYKIQHVSISVDLMTCPSLFFVLQNNRLQICSLCSYTSTVLAGRGCRVILAWGTDLRPTSDSNLLTKSDSWLEVCSRRTFAAGQSPSFDQSLSIITENNIKVKVQFYRCPAKRLQQFCWFNMVQLDLNDPHVPVCALEGTIRTGHSGRWTAPAITTDVCTFGAAIGCCYRPGAKRCFDIFRVPLLHVTRNA